MQLNIANANAARNASSMNTLQLGTTNTMLQQFMWPYLFLLGALVAFATPLHSACTC